MEISKKTRKMVKANSNGRIYPTIKVTSYKISFTVRANIISLTWPKHSKENFSQAKCKDLAMKCGKTWANNIKDFS